MREAPPPSTGFALSWNELLHPNFVSSSCGTYENDNSNELRCVAAKGDRTSINTDRKWLNRDRRRHVTSGATNFKWTSKQLCAGELHCGGSGLHVAELNKSEVGTTQLYVPHSWTFGRVKCLLQRTDV